MPGDKTTVEWIPMRFNLATEPRVLEIAAALKMDVHAVIGRLFCVWSWASQTSEDGIVKGASSQSVDLIANAPGFAAILVKHEWLRIRSSGIEFPNFDRWISKTARHRSVKSEQRRRQRDGTATSWRQNGDKLATERRQDEKPLDSQGIASKDEVLTVAKEEGGKGGGVSSSEKDNPPKSEAKQNQPPPKPPPLGGDVPATVDKPRRRRKRKTAESKPREPNPLFDAIADVCGVDPKLQGSQIGISCAKLKECEPPYTPEEVYAFGKRFHEFCSWAAKDGRARPTPTELSKWIGGLRTSPVPSPNLFDGMTPEKPTNVDHLL